MEEHKASDGADAAFIKTLRQIPPGTWRELRDAARAADDGTAPFENSVMYFEALQTAGVGDSRLEVEPHGGHGFGLCQAPPSDEQVCGWPDAAADWIGRLFSS